jgi:hypothetical protein
MTENPSKVTRERLRHAEHANVLRLAHYLKIQKPERLSPMALAHYVDLELRRQEFEARRRPIVGDRDYKA